MSRSREVDVRVEGSSVFVNGAEVRLRFLETLRDLPGGGAEPRVRVFCQGCRRFKAVHRVGLRHVGGGVIDLQANCHECRATLNARKRGEART